MSYADLLVVGPGLCAMLAAMLGLFVAIGWPRGRVTHRYEIFVAASPQTVWDTYFIHVRKADYRPGTRVIDATILSDHPLTVRLELQFDIASTPTELMLTYDIYEPYVRYRVREAGGDSVEEGEFAAEPGGTRLRVAVTMPMRGFLLPLLARRRVERNQQALKDVCEGRQPRARRGALRPWGRWEGWIVWALVVSFLVPLPWQLQLPLGVVAAGVGALYIWRLVVVARRL